MARSPLFTRKIPGGAFHVDNTAVTLGNIYYVDGSHSAKSTSASAGTSPDLPWSTVPYALDSTVLASGDMVLVATGHTETLAAAAAWDADTAGVHIKGLGWGNIRPTITIAGSADTTDIDIDAANVTIENFIFSAGFADTVAVIDVNADGFTARNCSFIEPTTDLNALIWILGAAAAASDRITVEGCECFSVDAANTHFISLPGTSDRCVIRDNFIHGFFETSAIGAAGAVTNISVLRNFIQNTDTDADACINLASSSTGVIAYNVVGAALAGNATTNITGGGTVTMIQNYSVDTGDRQGVLDPVATT